jgi:uncharacterized membrane protein YccC
MQCEVRTQDQVLYGVFMVRCAAAACLSHVLAEMLGLPFPVWASVSALIVSQERLAETRSSLIGRILGTLLGAAIAIVANLLGKTLGLGVDLQIIFAVLVCAAIAYRRCALRVSMWTSPLVLLTTHVGDYALQTAACRASEVILGGLIGAALHWFADTVLTRVFHFKLGGGAAIPVRVDGSD